jgi:hypothetical protein
MKLHKAYGVDEFNDKAKKWGLMNYIEIVDIKSSVCETIYFTTTPKNRDNRK